MLEKIEENLFEDGFIYFLIFSLTVLVIVEIITKALKKSEKYVLANNTKRKETSVRYLFKTIRAIVYILGAIAILSGIKPLRSLGTAALGATSIMAVIVGLAAQESFGNYISGFFLAIYEPFKIGDLVTLPSQGLTGTVKEITFRHIVIETVNGTNLIVPNSTMNTAIIEDKTGDLYKSQLSVSVAYDTDLDLAKKTLEEIVIDEEKKKGINLTSCKINVSDLASDGITLGFYIQSNSVGNSYEISCNVRERIVKEFKEKAINIPYQTRSIIIENEKSFK